MTEVSGKVHFHRVQTNGVELHYAEAGPADGALVFLLHGFPEFWYGWRNHIEQLATRGFRVIAPDQRGYNLSSKPKGVEQYDLDVVAADIIGLAEQLGRKSFQVVGHDWGASVGWWLASQHSERVQRLAVMNAPHPAVWLDALRNDPVQKSKSRYVRLFQLPYLPEFLLRLNHFDALARGFRDSPRTGAFTDTDLARYREAWSQPGGLTGMLNWYRAVLKKSFAPLQQYRIGCPTLVIWGKCDAYALPALAETSLRLCSQGSITYLDRATHWVQHDESEQVADLLTNFLRA